MTCLILTSQWPDRLADQVNAKIAEGYEPVGGMCVAMDSATSLSNHMKYAQAMTLPVVQPQVRVYGEQVDAARITMFKPTCSDPIMRPEAAVNLGMVAMRAHQEHQNHMESGMRKHGLSLAEYTAIAEAVAMEVRK